MEDKAVYDLKSLKWVILGIIISSISIFLQMGTGLVDTDLSSVVILFSVVRIIGWVVVILQLRKIREYGKFKKCYTSSLWMLVIMVVGISRPDFHGFCLDLYFSALYYAYFCLHIRSFADHDYGYLNHNNSNDMSSDLCFYLSGV